MQSAMNFASRNHDRSHHDHGKRKQVSRCNRGWPEHRVMPSKPPMVYEPPTVIAPTPVLPENLSIDLGGLLVSNFFAQISPILITAYDAALTRYPEIFIDLGQIIRDLPEFNFANPLTIDLGNTLSDRGFNQLVVFGDSLSDTGNLSKGLGGLFPPSPPFFDGRFSDGPLWLEYLAPELGISQVIDFAVGGSTSGRSNIASLLAAGQDLGKLPGVLDQIDLFAGQLAASGAPQANPNALYVVWGGANDFLALPQDPLAAIRSVLASVGNVAQAVTTLAGLGAKTILVPNLPDLGVTPFVATRNLTIQATIFSSLFNTLLLGTLGSLESDLGIDIVQVDTFSLSEAIARRPSEFGFTNTTTPLFQQLVNQPTQLVNPGTFVFADDFHPTTAVHRLISDAVERSLSASTPGKVLETSGLLLTELVSSSGFRSVIENLFNDSIGGQLATNGLLTAASGQLP
jgi:phospholipase/lecithinase/hemolysin